MPGMMDNPYSFFGSVLPLIILDLALKGFALWRSAKNNQILWFLAILLINSFGIIPAIYLIVIDKNYVFKNLQKRFSK